MEKALIDYINAQRLEAEEFSKKDGCWMGSMVEPSDTAYWNDRVPSGTLAEFKRTELEESAYYCIADAYSKSYARSFDFSSMTDAELDAEINSASKVCEENFQAEKKAEEKSIADFKTLIQDTIDLGAGDELTALRWLTQDEKFYHGQDVESWVWDKGLLFTDYGKELVKKLEDIVTYEDWQEAA
jgi:hypothetical protein|tara:strand:- start:834 stop:1388 length:555 start_codon:yes stop_codon:yes gene_type:complete